MNTKADNKNNKEAKNQTAEKDSIGKVCGDLKKFCNIGRKLKEDKEKKKG